MAGWKKHTALPVLAAAIALVVAFALNVYAKRDDGTFILRDLAGSRDAIGQVAISGELSDGYHRTVFRLQEGRLNTSTELFEQPRLADWYRYSAGGAKRIGDKEYSIMDNSNTFNITSRKRADNGSFFIPDGNALVTPSISLNRKNNAATYANPLEYGLAKVGDKVYFTPPVTVGTTGASGIYELRFFEWGLGSVIDRDAYAARKIADISLEANAEGNAPGIEILGLETVGSKLALLSVERNELRIRSYDSESGKWLGETAVPDFYLPGRPGTDSSMQAASYSESYEAHSDSGHDTLNLSFRGSSAQRLMLSIDFTDGVKVVHTVKTAFADGEEDSIRSLSFLNYRNGKLYVVKTLREPRTDPNDPALDLALPLHFYIYVFEQSKLVYKGELETDMNEDSFQSINRMAASGRSFGYDQKDFRHFSNISVE